jgi:hypothetical protein
MTTSGLLNSSMDGMKMSCYQGKWLYDATANKANPADARI